MRNEEHCDPEFDLQIPQQVDDLALDRNVQARNGFIGDQQGRRHSERSSDRNSLGLSAGELSGQARQRFQRQPDLFHQFHHAVSSLRPREARVVQCLFEMLRHTHPLIQRTARILEDHLGKLPHQPGCASTCRRHRRPIENDFTIIGLLEADEHPAQGRFAATGLTDEAEELAATDFEVNAVDRTQSRTVASSSDSIVTGEPPDDDDRRAFVACDGLAGVRHYGSFGRVDDESAGITSDSVVDACAVPPTRRLTQRGYRGLTFGGCDRATRRKAAAGGQSSRVWWPTDDERKSRKAPVDARH